MSGIIQNTLSSKNYEFEKKKIFQELMNSVKDTQTKYGGKTELVTENDDRVIRLCIAWENVLIHGLKNCNNNNLSIFKNVTELVSGNTPEPPSFWEFAYTHLTSHEKERFTNLRHIWTDRGRGRALIRAALNERSLERYVLMWLSDEFIDYKYENWALLRDPEFTHLLPSMAAGLNSVLFALSVDCPELNVPHKPVLEKPEPVIATPIPVKASKRLPIKRQVISFDDNMQSTSSSSYGTSVPKSFSNYSIKYNEIEEKKIVEDKSDTISVDGVPETPSSIHIFTFPSNDQTQSEEFSEHIETPPSDSGITEISEDSISSIHSKSTSVRGSTSSEISLNDLNTLKMLLAEKEERISYLDAQVAELSLENHRLRSHFLSSTRMHKFSVSIPNVILQKTNSKRYYSYQIEIKMHNDENEEWIILRRYSEFYRLHKQYQKDSISIKTLDFPPKKKIGNMNAHFVEQRRQRLQVYLKHLISLLPNVVECSTKTQLEYVFPFFKS